MYTSYHVIQNFSLLLSSDYKRNCGSQCDINRKTGLSNAFIWIMYFLRVKIISLRPTMYGLCYICRLYNVTVDIRMLI